MMSDSAISYQRQQEQVNAYFQSQAFFWKDIYMGGGVQSEVYRQRQARTLAWVDSLALPPGSSVLEIGCGAGFLAIALAQRGLCVQAIDATQAMLDLTRQHAYEAGMAEQVVLALGDVYALSYEKESFDLVLALGVIPWLTRPELAIQEMARVTKPGGHIILTADNWLGLSNLFDPWRSEIIRAFKLRLKAFLEEASLRHRSPHIPSRAECIYRTQRFIDTALTHAALSKIRCTTIGFGPFSFRWRYFLPDRMGIALHRRLQRLADRDVPLLRSLGSHYLVQAEKVAARSPL